LVVKAVITLEDPGFWRHRGIIVQALRNSLKDNLALGEFFRGGSTITQQLAKNLWLRRHKTLSRKVYEALLAMSLESCLSKDEILGLYLNVVEFGPDLYGIGPATKRYFDKDVYDLLADEAFFLARILPRPSKVVPPEQGGLENARRLMKQLVLTGHIEDVYLPDDGEEDNSEGWQTNEH
jgi:membrane peptidoglycan carboxypeptidase